MRLYELAKELGLTSRKLFSFYKSKKIAAKSNLAVLSDKQIRLARKVFARRVKLLESEQILKEAREAEEKERQKRKKDEQKKREKAKKAKAAREKKKPTKKAAPAKKKAAPAKKKAAPKKRTAKGETTAADKVAKRLKERRKAAPRAARKRPPAKVKKKAKEESIPETPVIKTEDESAQLAPTDIRRKIREIEDEATKRAEREERRAQFLRRRQAWSLDGAFVRKRLRRRPMKRKFAKRSAQARHVRPEKVTVEVPVSIRDFSAAIGVKIKDILNSLARKGVQAALNTLLDEEQVVELGTEVSVEVTVKEAPDVEEYLDDIESRPDRTDSLASRPPVITMLGHVDHGKTSLLDKIRQANVHEHEAGGITQHISAYRIDVDGRELVFVDTPGHEAFTEMRARGANVTDIVVLVVAADDGVMPQTEEAIDHAKAAGVKVVVALNKIDKPNANQMRAKQQLAALNLNCEEWGGDTVMVEVSALTGEGVGDLLEMLALSADMMELKANPDRPATGTVLEAQLTQGIGVVATVIVKNGTLSVGDNIVVSSSICRVRAIYDMDGSPINQAPPSWPVRVTGLPDMPNAGDKLYVVDDRERAKDAVFQRKERARTASRTARQEITLENLFAQLKAGKVKELVVVLKADTKGTADTVKAALEALSTEEVKVNILRAGVGDVSESDVLLADASEAIVMGFSVRIDENAQQQAEISKVDIRLYDVIYELTSDVTAAMEGLLEPEEREVVTGHCEVRQTFRASRIGVVAGSFVLDGLVSRSSRVRVKRADKVLFEGNVESLRRFKDDVREVKEGFECGIRVGGFDAVEVGDVIETYKIEKVARRLERKNGKR